MIEIFVNLHFVLPDFGRAYLVLGICHLFSLLLQNGKILNTLLGWNESTLIWVPKKNKASSSIAVCLIR
jgi:hypothetical protein